MSAQPQRIAAEASVIDSPAQTISPEVQGAAQKIRRLVGFAIADLRWIQDHAQELAYRVHCDADGGVDAKDYTRLLIARSGVSDLSDRLGRETPAEQAVTDRATRFLGTVAAVRQLAGEAKKTGQHVLPMPNRRAREVTEIRRGTLQPEECKNCGVLVYKTIERPSDYLVSGRCQACRKYWERTGRERPCPHTRDR